MILAFLLIAILTTPVHAAWNTTGGTSSAQNIVIGDNAVLDLSGDWTIAFMWKQNATSASDQFILSNSNTVSANPAFSIFCAGATNNINVRINDADSTQSFATTGAECATTGIWRRLFLQHTGDTMTLRLNDAQVATDTTVGITTMSNPSGGLFIGSHPDSTAGSNQAICDFSKWTTILNSTDRASLNFTSAAMFRNSQTIFIPAVRDFVEQRVGLTITNNGATVVDCPRLFRPN